MDTGSKLSVHFLKVVISLKENEQKIRNNLKAIELMVEQNMTEKEIAQKIEMPYTTFRRYKRNLPELKDAINNGADAKLQEVEQALHKNAVGYHYTEQIATKVKNEIITDKGVVLQREDVVVKDVKKYKGPDLSAEKYILNNKKKAQWKDDPHKVANDKKLTKIKETEVKAKVIEI